MILGQWCGMWVRCGMWVTSGWWCRRCCRCRCCRCSWSSRDVIPPLKPGVNSHVRIRIRIPDSWQAHYTALLNVNFAPLSLYAPRGRKSTEQIWLQVYSPDGPWTLCYLRAVRVHSILIILHPCWAAATHFSLCWILIQTRRNNDHVHATSTPNLIDTTIKRFIQRTIPSPIQRTMQRTTKKNDTKDHTKDHIKDHTRDHIKDHTNIHTNSHTKWAIIL